MGCKFPFKHQVVGIVDEKMTRGNPLEIKFEIYSLLNRCVDMNNIEQLEQRVRALNPNELNRFRQWFLEFDHEVWDQQIANDYRSGKFDKFIERAKSEFSQGKAKEL